MPGSPPRSSRLRLLLLVAVVAVIWKVWQSGVRNAAPPASGLPAVAENHLAELRPRAEPHDGFAGSGVCIECHADQHRSWSNSWHRTMTQVASLETFIGTLDEAVESEGVHYRFSKRANRPWVHVANPPEWFSPMPDIRQDYPIVMTTGSHLMQLGWFPIGHANTLGLLPIAYLKEDRRWVPHASIFLQPPDARSDTRIGIWNDGCIRCHTTGPESRRLNGTTFDRNFGFHTRVAEFGIACEACHGPGEAHVRLRRQAGDDDPPAPDPIVNPAALDHVRASEICGACHGDVSPRPDHRSRPFHQPGRPLNERYHINQPPQSPTDTGAGDSYHQPDGTTMYWADGMARVSGAEFSGMVASRCFIEGELSCLSCHSLHQHPRDSRTAAGWADDMLRMDALADAACLRCHSQENYTARRHTAHAADSAGSRCYNCHMPHTSYGLLKAIRSHKITSPTVRETVETGRLNACNLCHLDKSLAWTGEQLQRQYGQSPPKLSKAQRELSAAALQALTGDAGQRVLVAGAMGWPPAVSASQGKDWIPPHLGSLLADPYSAVRYVAGRSLRRFPGYEERPYDYLAPRDQLTQQADSLLDEWVGSNAFPTALINPNGRLNRSRFEELRKLRNDQDISLLE